MVKYAVFVRILRVAQLHEPFFEPLFLIVSYRRTRENNLFMPYFCELSRHKGRGLESRRLSIFEAKNVFEPQKQGLYKTSLFR